MIHTQAFEEWWKAWDGQRPDNTNLFTQTARTAFAAGIASQQEALRELRGLVGLILEVGNDADLRALKRMANVALDGHLD